MLMLGPRPMAFGTGTLTSKLTSSLGYGRGIPGWGYLVGKTRCWRHTRNICALPTSNKLLHQWTSLPLMEAEVASQPAVCFLVTEHRFHAPLHPCLCLDISTG